MAVLQVLGTDSGCQKVADHGRDLCCMRFQREVTRVEEMDYRTGTTPATRMPSPGWTGIGRPHGDWALS